MVLARIDKVLTLDDTIIKCSSSSNEPQRPDTKISNRNIHKIYQIIDSQKSNLLRIDDVYSFGSYLTLEILQIIEESDHRDNTRISKEKH